MLWNEGRHLVGKEGRWTAETAGKAESGDNLRSGALSYNLYTVICYSYTMRTVLTAL